MTRTGRWTVVLTVFAPEAKTVTRTFASEPEHREVEAFMNFNGADSAQVIPPRG